MWRQYNPNPKNKIVGDCTVRAISKALNQNWYRTYVDLCIYGLYDCDMPSSNAVCAKYLYDKGFRRRIVPFDNYTVGEFTKDHRNGTYILGLDSHIVTVKNSDFFDTWDSSGEPILYFWEVDSR